MHTTFTWGLYCRIGGNSIHNSPKSIPTLAEHLFKPSTMRHPFSTWLSRFSARLVGQLRTCLLVGGLLCATVAPNGHADVATWKRVSFKVRFTPGSFWASWRPLSAQAELTEGPCLEFFFSFLVGVPAC